MGIADMSYLSLYDLTGIQPYIFGSNILQENLGGSYLVKQALDEWLKGIANKMGVEFQWSGGGNAMVKTTSLDQAKQVATKLSRRLHQTAPGLYVACAHQPWDGSDADFKEQRKILLRELNAYKAGRWPPATFDGAGVTETCVSTGEPAVKWDKRDKRWLGPAARARLDHVDQATESLQKKIYSLPDDLVWTNQFDQLGRSHGEQSMLGVIHFDGNSMGQRFEKACSLPELRKLSEQVNEAGKCTLHAVLDWVTTNLAGITDVNKGGFKLSINNEKLCFPVRPIVYGGDDITLVCDARLALDLAAELLHAWHHHTGNLLGEPAHACAGIALVRVHYPFYRAYQLAEDLCKETKKYLRKEHGESADISALDWEFIAGAGLATLNQRRKGDLYRAASDKQEQLHARPYYVIGNPTVPYRDWDWFRNKLVHALQQQEETHTRFKELAGILHQGVSVTKLYLDRWRDRFGLSRAEKWDSKVDGLCLPEPKSLSMPDGFPHNETPYLDAIELMDRMLPLRCYVTNDKAEPAAGESP